MEKSDGVGGWIRTDLVDGFQLDGDFHVFLASNRKPGKSSTTRLWNSNHFSRVPWCGATVVSLN